jgi:hypothetical protein
VQLRTAVILSALDATHADTNDIDHVLAADASSSSSSSPRLEVVGERQQARVALRAVGIVARCACLCAMTNASTDMCPRAVMRVSALNTQLHVRSRSAMWCCSDIFSSTCITCTTWLSQLITDCTSSCRARRRHWRRCLTSRVSTDAASDASSCDRSRRARRRE